MGRQENSSPGEERAHGRQTRCRIIISPVHAALFSQFDVATQFDDVDVGRVLIDVRQTVENSPGGVEHVGQVAMKFVAQAGTEFRVILVDLVHTLDAARDRLVYRLVQRLHLRPPTHTHTRRAQYRGGVL